MNSNTNRRGRWAWRALAALVAAGQLVAPPGAVAETASASTVIQSRASATYTDARGAPQETWSNMVQTTVQQVGAFTVSAGTSKSAGPGASVAVMHTITNTGNGSDTFTIEAQDTPATPNQFTSIDVFADLNADGLADNSTSLIGGAALAGAARTSQPITIVEKQSYSYVVVYSVPPSAVMPWSNEGSVKVTAGNSTIGYTLQSQSVVDTINLATAAAFSAQLSHSAPSVVAVGGGSWGATPSSGERGTFTTYTFTYANNGAAAGDIYLSDTLPTGITYLADTAVWSGGPGVPLPNTGSFGASPLDKIAFQVTGQKVEALIKGVGVGVSGTLSFKVLVSSTASFGPLISQALHSSETCGAATLAAAATTPGCGAAPGATNLTASFTVLPTRGVTFGPEVDAIPGTATPDDTVTVANGVPGDTVSFVIRVVNTGNAPESFKLTLDSTGTFPAGTQFTWFRAGGVIPLQSAGGADVETDLVPSDNGTADVVLKAKLPGNATLGTVNWTAKATARSSNNAAKFDAVNVALTNVVVGLVDVTSTPTGVANVDLGPGVGLNAVSQTLSVTAGAAGQTSSEAANPLAGSAVYDLYIHNYHVSPLTFSLDSSLTAGFLNNTLPTGWTISFHPVKTTVAAALAAAPENSVDVPIGGQVRVLAVVTPLSTSSDVSALDIYFRASSTTAVSGGAIVSDQIRTQISVISPSTRGFVFSPTAGSRQVAPSSVADFVHTLLNNGTQSCGAAGGMKLTATISPTQTGSDPWTVVLYRDNGSIPGQYDNGDTLLQLDATDSVVLPMSPSLSPALASGVSYSLIARVYSPHSGAAGGSGVSVVLTVADQDAAPNCGSQTITNTVSVTVGQLLVNKWQRQEVSTAGTCATADIEPTSVALIDAKPGDCIVYRATVTNNGAAPVKNVSLHDTVPRYTSYHSTQPSGATVQCESTGLTPSATLTGPSGGALSCGGAANELNPGGTITLRFRVQLN